MWLGRNSPLFPTLVESSLKPHLVCKRVSVKYRYKTYIHAKHGKHLRKPAPSEKHQACTKCHVWTTPPHSEGGWTFQGEEVRTSWRRIEQSCGSGRDEGRTEMRVEVTEKSSDDVETADRNTWGPHTGLIGGVKDVRAGMKNGTCL